MFLFEGKQCLVNTRVMVTLCLGTIICSLIDVSKAKVATLLVSLGVLVVLIQALIKSSII